MVCRDNPTWSSRRSGLSLVLFQALLLLCHLPLPNCRFRCSAIWPRGLCYVRSHPLNPQQILPPSRHQGTSHNLLPLVSFLVHRSHRTGSSLFSLRGLDSPCNNAGKGYRLAGRMNELDGCGDSLPPLVASLCYETEASALFNLPPSSVHAHSIWSPSPSVLTWNHLWNPPSYFIPTQGKTLNISCQGCQIKPRMLSYFWMSEKQYTIWGG